jgi:hypothetical protein
MFPHDPAVTFNDFKSPGNVLEYDALAETLAASAPDDDSTSEFTCAAARSFSHLPVALRISSAFYGCAVTLQTQRFQQ